MNWGRISLFIVSGVLFGGIIAAYPQVLPNTGLTGIPNAPQGPQGQPGPNGNNGANGSPGSAWWPGLGVPRPAIGANRDMAIDTTAGDFYQKSAGAWVLDGNIKGSTGAAGSNGTNGTNGVLGKAQLTTSAAGSVTWTYPAPCT